MTEIYKQALTIALTGTNHIASRLIARLGADFADKYPFDADPDIIIQHLGPYEDWDMWCCWSAAMKASRLVNSQ